MKKKSFWVILSPAVVSLSFLWLLSLNGRFSFLVSSLYDFSQRFQPEILQGHLPYRDFLFEYPPLFYSLLVLTNFLSRRIGYDGADKLFVVNFFLLIPVLFTFYLSLVPPRRIVGALFLVIVGLPLAGASFDYLVVILVLAALLLFWRGFDLLSLSVLSLTVGIKIYPIIYLPLWFLKKRSRRRHFLYLLLFSLITFLPFLWVVSFGGAGGLGNFFLYHASRGIQYESILATPYFVLAALGLVKGTYLYRNHSFDVSYGTADGFLWFSSLLLFVVLYAIVLAKILKKGKSELAFGASAGFLLTSAFTLTLILLVTSKVFSAQYILWLTLLIPFLEGAIFFREIYLSGAIISILTVVETGLGFHHQQLVSGPLVVRNLLLLSLFLLSALETRKYFLPGNSLCADQTG